MINHGLIHSPIVVYLYSPSPLVVPSELLLFCLFERANWWFAYLYTTFITMRFSTVALTALTAASQAVASPVSRRDTESERANAVKQAFQIAWDGYYAYAFPHDQLHPVDNGYDDD